MGDVDGGNPEPALQIADLAPHVDAEPRIEIGERLVEKENLWANDKGARDGDTLELSTDEDLLSALLRFMQLRGHRQHLAARA